MTLGKEGERNNRKVGNWRKRENTNRKKKKQQKKMEKRKRLRGSKMKNRCTKENEKEYGMPKK